MQPQAPSRAAGLLHRAVYVWVFRPDGALLVQRRSPHKKIGPSQLDLSVAEHLQPGETYLQVGARGGSRQHAVCRGCAGSGSGHTSFLPRA